MYLRTFSSVLAVSRHTSRTTASVSSLFRSIRNERKQKQQRTTKRGRKRNEPRAIYSGGQTNQNILRGRRSTRGHPSPVKRTIKIAPVGEAISRPRATYACIPSSKLRPSVATTPGYTRRNSSPAVALGGGDEGAEVFAVPVPEGVLDEPLLLLLLLGGKLQLARVCSKTKNTHTHTKVTTIV